MANLTTSQQLEISEFFLSHAENRKEIGCELEATMSKCFAGLTILNTIQLGKIIRQFDHYDEVFSLLEEFSEEGAEIVEAYYSERLEQA
jgi:hypothetical protein